MYELCERKINEIFMSHIFISIFSIYIYMLLIDQIETNRFLASYAQKGQRIGMVIMLQIFRMYSTTILKAYYLIFDMV